MAMKTGILELENRINRLKTLAEDRHIPIDGMVLRYDSLSYSKRCGRTGHHYKDGIIADCVPEIADFMEEVMTRPETDDEFKEELLDIVIDTGEYLDEVS